MSDHTPNLFEVPETGDPSEHRPAVKRVPRRTAPKEAAPERTAPTPNLFDTPRTRRKLNARERAAAFQVLRFALVMDDPPPAPDKLELARAAMDKLKPLKRRK